MRSAGSLTTIRKRENLYEHWDVCSACKEKKCMQVVTDDTEILEAILTKISNCQYGKEGKIKVEEKCQPFQEISHN